MSGYTEANRGLWNVWTELRVTSEFYDVAGFKAERDSLDSVVTEGVGDVGGKRLLHLQCHFGLDTSWQHTFEDIVTSLLEAGPEITSLREYPYLAFKWFPFMMQSEDGYWRMPEGAPDIPLMFSVTATKR